MKNIVINQATIHDLDGIAELFNLYRMFYGKTSDIDGCKSFLLERIANHQSVIFQAKSEGKEEYIGFIQLYSVFSSVSMQRTLILNDLYVKEEFRRMSVAERLIDEVIFYGKKTGNKGLELATAVTNKKAQSLYHKFGFTKEAEYFFMSRTL
jgi:ribosomal protein S18 acetylase RimI-like enzyme